jgi:gliding motility-associated-like protein
MPTRTTLILFIALLFSSRENSLYCQATYINTQEGIYRLTGSAGICTPVPQANMCGNDLNLLSLAIYKDTLYYNTWSGDLKRFKLGVPGSCQTLILDGSTYNAMTVDKDGIIYMASTSLVRYNPHTNQLTNLGVMPFHSAGDLIFFRDKLLLAGFNPLDGSTGIYEININNVAASTLYMSTPSFIGLISQPIPCRNSKYFGIGAAPASFSQLVELDLVNRVVAGNICTIPLDILDAASTTETGIDDNVTFTSLQITKSCQATTGSVQVTAVHPSSGVITYTLDNSITNTSGSFPNLSVGQHTIVATAPGAICTNDTTFTIPDAYRLVTNIAKTNPGNCSTNAGSIVIATASGNPPVTFTLINSGISQASGSFTNLTGGIYNFHIIDAGGCTQDTTVQLNNATTVFVINLDVTPSRCNAGNGEIKIIVTGGDGTEVSSINNGQFSTMLDYPGLVPGSYYIQAKKGTSCYFDTTIVIAADNTQAGCHDIFIPNAFTPGNDGKNDIFKPSIPPTVNNVVLRIFNRWGEKVYEGSGSNVSWDGTLKGTKQAAAVYVYSLSFTHTNGAREILRGTLVLIR